MYASVTALLGVLLLVGMPPSASGQNRSTVAPRRSIERHRNPDYVAPATGRITADRYVDAAATSKRMGDGRLGWFGRLVRKGNDTDDVYTAPVRYGRYAYPLPVSTVNYYSRPFRNQLYSTDRPGPDPLQTGWRFGRPDTGYDPFFFPR